MALSHNAFCECACCSLRDKELLQSIFYPNNHFLGNREGLTVLVIFFFLSVRGQPEPGRFVFHLLCLLHPWQTSVLVAFIYAPCPQLHHPLNSEHPQLPQVHALSSCVFFYLPRPPSFLKPCCYCAEPCGILVPWPGTEPLALGVEAQSLNLRTTREIP